MDLTAQKLNFCDDLTMNESSNHGLLEMKSKVNDMRKSELIEKISAYIESPDYKSQLDLNVAPLLRREAEVLRDTNYNWQSFVLSPLMRSRSITGVGHLVYSWRVRGLPLIDEVPNRFCKNRKWFRSERWSKKCPKEYKCWESDWAELDAILRDNDGKWQAIFEYEDGYDGYCEVLCRTLKVIRWLKNEQRMAPVLCLFYWIPSKPKKHTESSKTDLLKWYVPFIKKHFYDFRGLRVVLILQSGPDTKPYGIVKTKVVSDEHDFEDLPKVLDKFA